jgi:hypothetical protein
MSFTFSPLCAHSSTEFEIPNGEIEALESEVQEAQGICLLLLCEPCRT